MLHQSHVISDKLTQQPPPCNIL